MLNKFNMDKNTFILSGRWSGRLGGLSAWSQLTCRKLLVHCSLPQLSATATRTGGAVLMPSTALTSRLCALRAARHRQYVESGECSYRMSVSRYSRKGERVRAGKFACSAKFPASAKRFVEQEGECVSYRPAASPPMAGQGRLLMPRSARNVASLPARLVFSLMKFMPSFTIVHYL